MTETADTEPTMTTRWRKKPVEIDAWPVAQLNHAAAHDWTLLPDAVRDAYDEGGWVFGALIDDERCISVPTLEGPLIAKPDDWIIRGVAGEFYPCKPDIFEQTYDPATGPVVDHRWRAIARNGRIVADSGEGYQQKSHATEMAHRLFPGIEIHTK